MAEAVLSVYEGSYDPEKDYDALEPVETLKLEKFGGVKPTPYPKGGGTYVVRGEVQVEESGRYRFKPGYGASEINIMEVDGTEVHRYEPGGERKFTEIKMEAGKKLPFKITWLSVS